MSDIPGIIKAIIGFRLIKDDIRNPVSVEYNSMSYFFYPIGAQRSHYLVY